VAEAWKKIIIKKITTHWYRRGFILPLSELTNSYHCPSEFQVKRTTRFGTVPGHCDKQSCIVSEGTPDLSGRAFHHATRCRMNAAFRRSVQVRPFETANHAKYSNPKPRMIRDRSTTVAPAK
jgi:hypothetical protein